MFDQVNNLIDRVLSGKKSETPQQRLSRLKALAAVEEINTKELEIKLQQQREINALKEKILNERHIQQDIYRDLGVMPPQIQRQRQLRTYVFLAIIIIVIILVVRSCF